MQTPGLHVCNIHLLNCAETIKIKAPATVTVAALVLPAIVHCTVLMQCTD